MTLAGEKHRPVSLAQGHGRRTRKGGRAKGDVQGGMRKGGRARAALAGDADGRQGRATLTTLMKDAERVHPLGKQTGDKDGRQAGE